MFRCKVCEEKSKVIARLEAQNKDLLDRLMAYSKEALCYYKAETKEAKVLYPIGVDNDGKLIDYKDLDIDKAQEEVFRAMGEESMSVEDNKPED
jgi:hypothetical protein